MLLSGNLWLSMASLVICMHIRFLCNELQKLYIKHLTYHRVVFDMEHRYPHVNHEGECLICWETFRLILYFQNKAAFNKLKMKEISLYFFGNKRKTSGMAFNGHFWQFQSRSNNFPRHADSLITLVRNRNSQKYEIFKNNYSVFPYNHLRIFSFRPSQTYSTISHKIPFWSVNTLFSF